MPSLGSIDRKLISLFSCKQGKLQFRVFCLAQKRQMIAIILNSYTEYLKPFGLTMSRALSGNAHSLRVYYGMNAPRVLAGSYIVSKDGNRGTQSLGLSYSGGDKKIIQDYMLLRNMLSADAILFLNASELCSRFIMLQIWVEFKAPFLRSTAGL